MYFLQIQSNLRHGNKSDSYLGTEGVCCNGCTRMLQTSVSNVSFVFQTYVAECLSGCCICFTHMLQVFYLDVACVFNGFKCFFRCFCKCFRRMFLSVSSIFIRMLQVLHLPPRLLPARFGVSPSPSATLHPLGAAGASGGGAPRYGGVDASVSSPLLC
jgi:hypothetical protein